MSVAIGLGIAGVVAAPFLGRWRAKIWLRENGFPKPKETISVATVELV